MARRQTLLPRDTFPTTNAPRARMKRAPRGWSVRRRPDRDLRPGERTTLFYTIRVGPGGIQTGGKIFFSHYPAPWGIMDAALFATRLQITNPRARNHVTVKARHGRIVPVGTQSGWILFKNVGNAIPCGASLNIVLGDSPPGRPGLFVVPKHPRYDTVPERFVIEPRGDGKRIALALPGMPVVPDRPRYVFARSATHAVAGEPFPLTVEIADRFGNPVTDFTGTLSLTTSERATQRRIRQRGDLCTVISACLRTPGIHRPKVELVSDTGKVRLKAVANPVAVTKARQRENVYWGEIHAHSNVSTDGVYSPDFCCRYARDVARLDFFALSDHGETMPFDFDEKDFAAPSRRIPYDRPVPEDFQNKVRAALRKVHRPGEFVTLFGYEYNGDRTGQVNVYHMDDDEAFICGCSGEEGNPPDTPVKLCRRLKGKDAIVIPHHPAYARDNMGFAWEHFVPEWMPVVEIYSARHGSSEFKGCPRSVGAFDPQRSIQTQLALGRRFGFTGGTDSHIGMAARRIHRAGGPHQRGPERIKYNSGGLTAVFAEELTRTAVMDALRRRRCYAVSGDRLLLAFHLGRHPMGAIIPLSRAAPYRKGRTFHIAIDASAKVERVELIRNNKVIRRFRPRKRSVSIRTTDETPLGRTLRATQYAGRQVFYYCRVTLANREMAWASPIWIGKERP